MGSLLKEITQDKMQEMRWPHRFLLDHMTKTWKYFIENFSGSTDATDRRIGWYGENICAFAGVYLDVSGRVYMYK